MWLIATLGVAIQQYECLCTGEEQSLVLGLSLECCAHPKTAIKTSCNKTVSCCSSLNSVCSIESF